MYSTKGRGLLALPTNIKLRRTSQIIFPPHVPPLCCELEVKIDQVWGIVDMKRLESMIFFVNYIFTFLVQCFILGKN